MTTYEKQRQLLDEAKAKGWPGEIPGVLGDYTANKAVEEARRFLEELEEEERHDHAH